MHPLEDLSHGLLLPNRGIVIPWGGNYDSLLASASEANDWLPHGHNERYGQLHWDDETLLPGSSSGRIKGKVIGYVKGAPLTLRRFECYIWDDSWLKREAFRYAAWMHELTRLLGPPEIDATTLVNANLYAPTLAWRNGPVTIESFYCDAKGDEWSGVRISHQHQNL